MATTVEIAITTGIGADNQMQSTAGTSNKGTDTSFSLITTQRRATIRFDLSGIPSGQVCTAATLKLYWRDTNGVDDTISLYKITDANGNWVEGTSATPAASGDPCWNAKKADGSGGVTTAWAGSAGLSTAGTDFVNTVIASAVTPSTVSNYALFEIPFNAAGLLVLTGWFTQATNNGILMVRTDGTTTPNFRSKEDATAGYRPVLSVTYEDAPPGGTEVLIANILASEILNSRIVR